MKKPVSHIFTLSMLAALTLGLEGCAVAKTTGKVAAIPVKAVGKTTSLAGKGIYKTTKVAGKSVYYMGKVPVVMTDKALDTGIKVMQLTVLTTTATGELVATTRQIQAAQLDKELAALRGATGIMKIIVDGA